MIIKKPLFAGSSMRQKVRAMRTAMLSGTLACTPVPPMSAPVPVSQAPSPTATPATPSTPATPTTTAPAPSSSKPSTVEKSWSFTPALGRFSYMINTEAQIAQLPDSAHPKTVPTEHQRVVLEIADSGTVHPIEPQIAGDNHGCDSVAILVNRVEQLIPSVPSQLTPGLTWSDSTTIDGCRGEIPARTTTGHTYVVVGDTTFQGENALHLQRSDVIRSRGEGADGQHRILMTAIGAGFADLYLDAHNGIFLGSVNTQTSTVEILTSGRTTRFQQRIVETVSLIKPQ